MNTNLAKAIAIWCSLIGSIVFWGGFLVFITCELITKQLWISSLIQEKPEVILFIPLAALASFCNVLILKITDGPIEFKIIGMTFSGAAGPIIMWVISFLSICLGIKILWSL